MERGRLEARQRERVIKRALKAMRDDISRSSINSDLQVELEKRLEAIEDRFAEYIAWNEDVSY